ncbi:hypothetical protein FCL47_02150 [Desulfopila sp. IMCC35006]|uniref:hypothetical protein n=1 Tax=Desulfopila sp. IMCC35006 TaxID=2569542 RepID=UPI0010ABA972|nr:hypothetical protein [Desulfopila sp. IMCC35006]TKB28317.1 hypothetical protein FCL47_02150 [Desulfopila sp. IMCC35006]
MHGYLSLGRPDRIKLLPVMHMNSFDTLIFPDTELFQERYFPLLLFCSPLHFLQPVEPGPDAKHNEEATHFYQRDLWRAHTPAPLGVNRTQFLRLLDDIKTRREYYVDQLNGLITGAGAVPDNANRPREDHALVASLLKEHGIAGKDIEGQLELWQSRLILSIAEILEREEDDLQEETSYFNAEELEALRSLKKEDGSDAEYLLQEMEKFTNQRHKPHENNMQMRFNAWAYLMHLQPLPAVSLWLASTRTAAEQILQRYTSASGKHAVPLLKLALPAAISASGKYVVERIEAFHQATAFIHRGLAADFARITATVPYMPDSPDSLLPYGTDWADQWETMLYDSFPAAQDGRTSITFYLLPGQPVAGLLTSPYPGKKENDDNRVDSAAHGLLGILGSA